MAARLIRWDKDNKIIHMKIKLINGTFTKEDSIHLLSLLVDAKVRFHESKISLSDNEEDIQWREHRIQTLQQDWSRQRELLQQMNGNCIIECDIIGKPTVPGELQPLQPAASMAWNEWKFRG